MDVIVTRGSYTIIEKDGSMTVVNYTADENGFHPEVGESDHQRENVKISNEKKLFLL